MSDIPTGDDVPGVELQAAEYVLGTLDYRERAAFAERLRGDAAARAAVAAWERRLSGLSDVVAPVTPPTEIWPRIERAIGGAGVHPFRVLPGGGAGTRVAALQTSRDRWRLGALASGLVAAALAIVMVGGNRATPPAPEGDTYVAAINPGGAKPAMIVKVDLATRKVTVRPVTATTPAGHSLELWYIDPGKAPRSVGVIDSESRTLTIPAGAGDGAPATMAVSVEPLGGSKTGGPTGPVVYSGDLVKE